jgi:hypothetical protein
MWEYIHLKRFSDDVSGFPEGFISQTPAKSPQRQVTSSFLFIYPCLLVGPPKVLTVPSGVNPIVHIYYIK